MSCFQMTVPTGPFAVTWRGVSRHLTGDLEQARNGRRMYMARSSPQPLLQRRPRAQLALLAIDEEDVEGAEALSPSDR